MYKRQSQNKNKAKGRSRKTGHDHASLSLGIIAILVPVSYTHLDVYKRQGLDGVKLIVGDKCLGMLEAVGEVFPDAKYQRCTVHFYRNVFSVVPRSRVKLVAKMLKAIHAQESKKAAREKAKAVVAQLKEMKLKEAAKRCV